MSFLPEEVYVSHKDASYTLGNLKHFSLALGLRCLDSFSPVSTWGVTFYTSGTLWDMYCQYFVANPKLLLCLSSLTTATVAVEILYSFHVNLCITVMVNYGFAPVICCYSLVAIYRKGLTRQGLTREWVNQTGMKRQTE